MFLASCLCCSVARQKTVSGMAVACFASVLAPEYTEGTNTSCKHTMHACAIESRSITPACRTFVASVLTARTLRQMWHVYLLYACACACIEKLGREGGSIHQAGVSFKGCNMSSVCVQTN